VDGMTIDDAKDYLREHWPSIRPQLLDGTYQPQPVKRVEIPKPDGGVRKLGVPCVVLDSVRYTRRNLVGPLTTLLEGRVRRKELVPVAVEGGKSQALDRAGDPRSATGAWG